MRLFLTGSTGYVGTALCRAALGRGHEVLGLTRGRPPIDGVTPVRGDLSIDFPPADVAIHAAFDYGVDADDAKARDLDAVRRLLASAPFVVYTSSAFGNTRDEQERAVLDGGGAVIRCGFVYGRDGGMLAEFAKEPEVPYAAPGDNRWSMVHCDDLAELYMLVAEQRARGTFHCVDGTTPTAREVIESVANGRAVPLDEARAKWGSFADTMARDVVADNTSARALGWTPRPFFR